MKKYLFIICIISIVSMGALYFVLYPNEFEEFMSQFEEQYGEFETEGKRRIYIYHPYDDGYHEERTDNYHTYIYVMGDETTALSFMVRDDKYMLWGLTYYRGDYYYSVDIDTSLADYILIEDLDMSEFKVRDAIRFGRKLAE